MAKNLFGYLVSDLWTYTVPQRCLVSPVVRSAVVALGSVHLDFCTASNVDVNGTLTEVSAESLRLYGVALTHLRVHIDQDAVPSRAEVLLSCLALICFDLLRGKRTQATDHLDNGIAVIDAWNREMGLTAPAPEAHELDKLATAFCALDVHATAYDDNRIPALQLGYRHQRVDVSTPDVLNSIGQAQSSLMRLISAACADLIVAAPYKFRPIAEVPQRYRNRRRTLREAFQRWLTALDHFETQQQHCMPSVSSLGTRELSVIRVMRIQHRALELLLHENLQSSEPSLSFGTAGEQLLDWTEDVMGPQLANEEQNAQGSFSVDMGLGPPLFLLALKTTDRRVRQRATLLLSRITTLEGWYAPQAILQTIHRLEMQQHEVVTAASLCCSYEEHPAAVEAMSLEWFLDGSAPYVVEGVA